MTPKSCPDCHHQTAHWAPTCLKCGHRYAPAQSAAPAAHRPAPVEPPSPMMRDMARLKSYTGACVVTFLLYCFFFVPGLIANACFLADGKRMEKVAGCELPGVGALKVMLFIVAGICAVSTVLLTGILILVMGVAQLG